MKAPSLGRAEKTGPADAVNLLSPSFLEDLAVLRLRSQMALGRSEERRVGKECLL